MSDSLSNKYITDIEYNILRAAITNERQEIQAADVKALFPGKSSPEISRLIRSLVDKKMLVPVSERARKCVISFGSNYLLRSVLKSLDKNGFLPLND